MSKSKVNIPIVTDLDGTLVLSDTLVESVIRLIVQRPIYIILLPFWILFGRVAFKKKIAEKVTLDFSLLPYHKNFIKYLSNEKKKGRKLILATGAHKSIASLIAKQLDLFDCIHATDEVNLTGKKKADLLIEKYGINGFDYAGNSSTDLHVWQVSRNAIAVNASPSVVKKLRSIACESMDISFSENKTSYLGRIKSLFKAMRIKQWVKNCLIFTPLLLSQSYINAESVVQSIVAFIAFSICASSVYLLNDLVDLDSDRQHKYKKFRPFASGELDLSKGALASMVAFAIGFILAYSINELFFWSLGAYYLTTLFYTFKLKKLILFDIFTLAILYTFRLLAGGAAIEINLSNWLLSFSFFIFLSLGTLKRYVDVDLDNVMELDRKKIMSAGRGYIVADLIPLLVLGVSSGLISILIFLLYVSDPEVLLQYNSPHFLWLVGIALVYWISNIWFLANRNLILEDPVMFVLKEKNSRNTLIVIISMVTLAIYS